MGCFAKYSSNSDSLLNPTLDSSESFNSETLLLTMYCIMELFWKLHFNSQLHVFLHAQRQLQSSVQLSQHIWAGFGEVESSSFVNATSKFLRRQPCAFMYVFISGSIFLLLSDRLYLSRMAGQFSFLLRPALPVS